MGPSGSDIMTRPIALCWAPGVKWGLSVPRMQAFVRTRGIRQELHSGVK